jgi:JmjC domain
VDASQYAIASRFLGRLWSAVLPTIEQPEGPSQLQYIPRAFESAYLLDMPLPLADERKEGQAVALVDGAEFHREVTCDAIARGYEHRRRTRVYEGMDVASDGWYSVVAVQLARLARCRVVCSMYESNAGDRNLGAHVDGWLGAIVQMRGAKKWSIWPDSSRREPQEFLTEVGDVLLLPRDVEHAVETPDYSAHLVFALLTDEPIEDY